MHHFLIHNLMGGRANPHVQNTKTWGSKFENLRQPTSRHLMIFDVHVRGPQHRRTASREKKTLTWIQKEVVQPRLCSSLSRCAPWNRTLTQTFRYLQVRQLVISEIGNIYASMCFLGRCPTFCPVSMLVVPVLRWDLAKPMIKFLGVDSRQQHS